MDHEVERRAVRIWSEGSRLAAEVVRPAAPDGAPDGARPAVLLCHGWGGLKEHLAERYAAPFARAGFVCLVFDYRGWGGSDGRLIPAEDEAPLLEAGARTVRARVVREVVDPLDQIADIRACLAWLMTEPGVDPARVGLWGSSYGGGHVVCVAGQDARVRAVVAQIGGYGPPTAPWFAELAQRRAADKARGAIDPPVPQGVDAAPGLRGTPDVARQLGHAPLDPAARIRAPTLFLDAADEEYGEPATQGLAAYEVVRLNAPAERHAFPGGHYELYDRHHAAALRLATEWLTRHL